MKFPHSDYYSLWKNQSSHVFRLVHVRKFMYSFTSFVTDLFLYSQMIPISIFFLVIAASIFHAIWNFFARKVKGNMGVVWIGFFLGDFFVGPVAIYFIVKDIQNQVDLTGGLIWGFWSGKFISLFL